MKIFQTIKYELIAGELFIPEAPWVDSLEISEVTVSVVSGGVSASTTMAMTASYSDRTWFMHLVDVIVEQ
jgi:hypothetical protein